ncbi:MAG: flavodoxin-dependent (E)-4-hydroxy-3-methylbut-2-enyl-diphosphate synthase [Candidatus Tectomicrobia bacterium]|uniref:4-hydroxy-3-methylbut-2-en-1-yl diphosphate synthase (flavodoxin) n=1 Tax=Tectimicrobiota bacterium TaxID=2528274 RepID=A0A932I4D1_UNCTE|nr:flavodoxin-dependent (E)-4-hydroxy-3-methylbut-2-enyl-diphosphate synthase [Candidatus Tectomicrobia bacterium]
MFEAFTDESLFKKSPSAPAAGGSGLPLWNPAAPGGEGLPCADPHLFPLKRRRSRPVSVRGVRVGGGAPVAVQSMCNTYTWDVEATLAQIARLQEAGCEIIRLAVPDERSAEGFKKIRKRTDAPLVADIHFDYRLALMAAEAGADCLRINPGNINGEGRVSEVVAAAKDRGLPIRVGVNAGSLEKHLLDRFGGATPEAMVESGLRHVAMLEKRGFYDTKISLKASDVTRTVQAYRLMARRVEYPLHLGITESGSLQTGSLKSAVGLGILLSEGIGDTIRVSLAADPAEEVRVGFEILKSLRLRQRGVNVVACPSCGRVQIDVDKLTLEVEKELAHITAPITVAVMGCEVNGPGEAREADIGVAGGHKRALIFMKGEKQGLVDYKDIKRRLVEQVEALAAQWGRREENGEGRG